MKAIVLAGGHDDRLGPLTFDTPAAALPLAGEALIVRLLDYLERQGIANAAVSCFRGPQFIERAVKERDSGMPVATVLERPPFGSANVVCQLADHLEGTFLVVVGDVLTDLELSGARTLHAERGALATVVVCDADPPCRYGEVAVDRHGAVVMLGTESLVLREGKRIANTGIYLFEPEVLKHVPRDRCFDLAADLLPLLIEKDLPVLASHPSGYWRPIGSIEQYRMANLDLLQGRIAGSLPVGENPQPSTWIGGGASIDPGASVKPPILIGSGCRIERDAVIGPCAVLGDQVHIKRGAIVSGSVVLSGSKVGLATKLENAVVRGNVLVAAESSEPTYIDDRQMLETLQPVDVLDGLRSAVDRVLAFMALLFLTPLMFSIALLIRLDSRGPIFYSQLRVGQGKPTTGGQYRGRVFELMKFRTMHVDADRRLKEVLGQNEYGSSAFVKIKDDPRVTRIGRLLRATSLDELPQFINVVRGDMRLVGNRPLPLYEAERLSDEWQQVRFGAPAGMTGLWQISGRSDLSAEERMVLDNYYALTHSLWSDMKILLVTIPALVARRGAR